MLGSLWFIVAVVNANGFTGSTIPNAWSQLPLKQMACACGGLVTEFKQFYIYTPIIIITNDAALINMKCVYVGFVVRRLARVLNIYIVIEVSFRGFSARIW